MRVKVKIVFEAEYPMNLEFYDMDEKQALELERKYISVNPLEMIELSGKRGKFTTLVEQVNNETT